MIIQVEDAMLPVHGREKRKEKKLRHKGKNAKKKGGKSRFISKIDLANKRRHLDVRNLDGYDFPEDADFELHERRD